MILQLRYWLEYGLTRVLVAFLNVVPLSVSSFIVSGVSALIFPFLVKRRKIGEENITRAFGDTLAPQQKNRLMKTAFRNTALSLLDLFLVDKIKKNAAERFNITGYHHLEHAFSKGRGVVLVISHLGSWELLAFLPFLRKEKWSVVVKAIKNPYLNQKIDELRRQMKLFPISKVGSIKKVLTELKNNNGVAILIDQWAGPEGIWVDFFGSATSTTSIPARLAKQTGCALVPAYCLRKSVGSYDLCIEPSLEIPDGDERSEEQMTCELNRLLEIQILKFPEQWAWMHRRWKSKPHYLRQPPVLPVEK